jgi:hypothetical protein
MTRTSLTTLTLVSASLLVAQALPGLAIKETIPIAVPAKKPAMFEDCVMTAVERSRICNARSRSERTKKG